MKKERKRVIWIYRVKPKHDMKDWSSERTYQAVIHEFSTGKVAIYKDNITGQAESGYRLYSDKGEIIDDFDLIEEIGATPGLIQPDQKQVSNVNQ